MDRYLVDFDTANIKTEYHDVIIIGSGIAGVYTALEIPQDYDVIILTKETIEISNSVLAQGGIAVSLDKEDSPKLHFKDTIKAGAGLCDEDSVWVLVNEAAENIGSLCKYGVDFDKKNFNELSLTREGAHSKNRIIHAGDTTGKEVCDKLISIVKTKENVNIKERTFVVDLITKEGSSKGVIAYDEDKGSYILYLSKMVVCATGGFGKIYSNTTNPEVATGDGIALAYRAGAELMDLEFIQFHPTVLFHSENKNFLISEAVRGEGALLRNINGERFMHLYHELAELAPRDVVSRSIFNEMKKTRASNVYLDITFKEKSYLKKRFPNIHKTCLEYGIDISKDYIPVAPAEHYCMGGIRADIYGRTNIKGLYACGESACNGIHGANRLASNSLLEGLVFGSKIGSEVKKVIKNNENPLKLNDIVSKLKRVSKSIDRKAVKLKIQNIMTMYVGIERDRECLLYAKDKINEYYDAIHNMKNSSIEDFELQNIVLLSKLVIESALEREESRGAHYRSDFSKNDDIKWKKNIIKSKN
uniref:L-aspartate oxidase n=1 Tax=Herbivorax sp. ANBcel31 TaxID=3069754 RepID=UPI0035941BE8